MKERIRKPISLLLALALCLSLLPAGMVIARAAADPVLYLDPTEKDENGVPVTRECTDYTIVTGSTSSLENGWYVVNSDLTVSSRITVTGTVNLILCDGATLTAKKGITVSKGNSLTVYARSDGENMGKLFAGTGDGTDASCKQYCAAIGGGDGGYTATADAVTGTIVHSASGQQWLLIEDVLGDVANGTSRLYHIVRRAQNGDGSFGFVQGDLYERETLEIVKDISYGQTDEEAKAAVQNALGGQGVEGNIIYAASTGNEALFNYLQNLLKSKISEEHSISFSVMSAPEPNGSGETLQKYRYEISIYLDGKNVRDIVSFGNPFAMAFNNSFDGSKPFSKKDGFIKTVTETAGSQTVTKQLLLIQGDNNSWTAYTKADENDRIKAYGLNMGDGSFGTPEATNDRNKLDSLDGIWFVSLPNTERVTSLTALKRIGSGATVKNGDVWELNGGYFEDDANNTYRFVQAADQNGSSGNITINGGKATAIAGEGGAGIGGGRSGGGSVTVRGGTVTAIAGEGGEAVGHGQGSSVEGSLDFSGMKVFAFDAEGAKPVPAADRMRTCRSEKVKLTECDHKNTDGTFAYEKGVCKLCLYTSDNPMVTAKPTASKWIADGAAHPLLTDGGTSSSGSTIYYSLDGKDYSASIPTKTDAGIYFVWFKAVDNTTFAESAVDKVTARACFPVTFRVANGEWDNGGSDPITLPLSCYANEDLALTLTNSDIPAVGNKPDDSYKAGSWDLTPNTETAITQATTYTYTYAFVERAVVATAPIAQMLTHNGHAQQLVLDGIAEGGTMQYALGPDAATAPTSGWIDNPPLGTDIGTYYVWYKAVGDENHRDSIPAGPITVMILGESDAREMINQKELTEVPTELAGIYSSFAQMQNAMMLKLVIDGEPVQQDHSVMLDVQLLISPDGGQTWLPAKEENFPSEGLTAMIDYPEGTNKDDFDFAVSHMFTVTSARLGTKAGEVENCSFEKTDAGLRVTLHGLSPVLIAWAKKSGDVTPTPTETPTPTPAPAPTAALTSVPKTGDGANLGLWIGLIFLGFLGIITFAGMAGRKHRNR